MANTAQLWRFAGESFEQLVDYCLTCEDKINTLQDQLDEFELELSNIKAEELAKK